MSIEWQGPQDGLPPVGTVCIADWYKLLDGSIRYGDEVEIMDYKDGFVWFRWATSQHIVVDANDVQFSPIQSERDKGIDEAMSHIRQDWYAEPSVSISEFVTNAVTQLYDAGYRKPMSRAEAHEKLTLMMMNCDNGEDIRDLILDALGYKE